MKCPVCEAKTRTIESRVNDNNTRRRRYECQNRHRFTTIEGISEESICAEQEPTPISIYPKLSAVWFPSSPSSAQ